MTDQRRASAPTFLDKVVADTTHAFLKESSNAGPSTWSPAGAQQHLPPIPGVGSTTTESGPAGASSEAFFSRRKLSAVPPSASKMNVGSSLRSFGAAPASNTTTTLPDAFDSTPSRRGGGARRPQQLLDSAEGVELDRTAEQVDHDHPDRPVLLTSPPTKDKFLDARSMIKLAGRIEGLQRRMSGGATGGTDHKQTPSIGLVALAEERGAAPVSGVGSGGESNKLIQSYPEGHTMIVSEGRRISLEPRVSADEWVDRI